MSEGGPTPEHEMQHGHFGNGLDQGALGPTGAGLPRRPPGEPDVETAYSHAESLSSRAQAAAEELLSRAHVHAELLRVHAEAARAEAESLRAEAAALRRAARDEAASVGSRAEALLAQTQAAAEEFRSAMEDQAAAAGAEVTQLRTEAASLRRALQAEIETSRAEAQRMRAEFQSLRAETDKLAAELRVLSTRAGAAAAAREDVRPDGPHHHEPEGGERAHLVDQHERETATPPGPRPGEALSPAEADRRVARLVAELTREASGRLEDLRRAMALELQQRLAEVYADDDRPRAEANASRALGEQGRQAPWPGRAGDVPVRRPPVAEIDTGPGPDPAVPQFEVRELIREIWDAANAPAPSDQAMNGTGRAPSGEAPVDASPDRPRASEPIIGSGGWRSSRVPTSSAAPADDPGPGERDARRHGRSFRRRG